MKYIPVEVFETINSLIQSVEAQGCLLTIRLEAYTCRHTREEKQLASTIAERKTAQSRDAAAHKSPILQPQSGSYQHGGYFPSVDALPPPSSSDYHHTSGTLVDEMGVPQTSAESACDGSSPSSSSVDDRLVYLVAALNAIHGDGYDFSVLEESDFDLLDPHFVRREVDNLLSSLPESCGAVGLVGPSHAHDIFWLAIAHVIGSGSAAVASSLSPIDHMFQSCDFFMFKSPSCDPIAQRTVWSNHIFIYSKRQRVMVSLLCYGEGNMYRGDDGVACAMPPRCGSAEYYYDGERVHYMNDGDDESSQQTTTTDNEWVVTDEQKNAAYYY